MNQRQLAMEASRRAIIDAAGQQFAAFGYEATTFSRVAEAMGKPKSAIGYHLFPSKKDLATIRPQLDAIDTDLVTALGQLQTVAQDHRCAHLVDAERKHLDVGLDSLHRKGIDVAWHTFCAA